ncbi:MAG: hypothetical protein K8H74_19040 [Notoacmeibacter sp.]|nr:hypothetical protein [Notoacmeibacter sp.]
MRIMASAFLAFSVLSGSAAYADPTGTFDVVGTNPDTGKQYRGTVSVARTGETYAVVWNIGGSEFIGTGLGAKFVGNRFVLGAASPDDTAISVGYVSETTFGMAMYFEQDDGHWEGAWTYGGSQTAAPEDWYPR